MDAYPCDLYERYLPPMAVRILDRAERELDARWDRATAEFAIPRYSRGWLEQRQLGGRASVEAAAAQYGEELRAEMEVQLIVRGYFVPSSPVRMVLCQKVGESPWGDPPN